ncbi:MAG: single-stranded DNA-binding protein [Naasia sp.]
MQERITLIGRAAGEPLRNAKEGGSGGQGPVSFRFATKDSRFDEATRSWVETETNWYTVKAWRSLGENALESVRKGQPLIVHGRLELQSWTDSSGRERITPTVHAESLGHDLRRGITAFSTRARTADADGEPGPPAGGPVAAEEPADSWADPAALVDAPF